MKYIWLFGLWLLCWQVSNAQRGCATEEYLLQQLEEDPGLRERMDRIERFTQRYQQSSLRSQSQIIQIPVVVHIVYKEEAQNLSLEQIESQLRILNEDFRRLNADTTLTPAIFQPIAGDIQLEFCLASVDPEGNPTTGITRTATSNTFFSSNTNDVKYTAGGGIDAWDPDVYLNMWVCNLAGNILGYAQYPGGNPETDGVVIDYEAFGDMGTAVPPFHLGRTGTHEVGHYLNLRHVWGNGGCSSDDYVADTPVASGANYNSLPCDFPGNNSCTIGNDDLPDMFQNYMDYSDDACVNLFTKGQKERMRAQFAPGGWRYALVTSDGCGVREVSCTDGIQNGDETGIDCGGTSCMPCACFEGPVYLTLMFDDYPLENSWEIQDSTGQVIAYSPGYGTNLANAQIQDTFNLPPGQYTWVMEDLYGDGICCTYGNGFYELRDANGMVIASGGNFGAVHAVPFCLDAGCPDSLRVTEVFTDTATYSAMDQIEVTTNQAVGSDLEVRAPVVVLQPGFRVPAGATFRAIPESCLDEPEGQRSALPSPAGQRADARPRISLFPNPATSTLRLSANLTEPARVSIWNALGQAVGFERALPAGAELRINISHLQPGLYWVVIRTGSRVYSRRLIVW
jgi:hypothetical protein